jgi:hypothetical protein
MDLDTVGQEDPTEILRRSRAISERKENPLKERRTSIIEVDLIAVESSACLDCSLEFGVSSTCSSTTLTLPYLDEQPFNSQISPKSKRKTRKTSNVKREKEESDLKDLKNQRKNLLELTRSKSQQCLPPPNNPSHKDSIKETNM